MRGRFGWLAALYAIAIAAGRADAATLAVPLNVDYQVLDAAVSARFYTGPGKRAEFWDGADNCGHFFATDPHFSRRGVAMQLRTHSDIEAALPLAGQCLSALSWTGDLAAIAQPRIDNATLKLLITDVNFYNPDGTSGSLGNNVVSLIRSAFVAQLESFSYDLRPYLERLHHLADNAPPSAADLRKALASMQLGPQVIPQDDGLTFTLKLTVPDALMAPLPAATPLTTQQRMAWKDAAAKAEQFLANAANQANALVADERLRSQLDTIISDSRRRLAVAEPPPGGDPLPLFASDWQQLRTALKDAAHRGIFGDHTLEMLESIAVIDALFAIDRQAPALGERLVTLAERSGAERARGADESASRGRSP